MGRAVLGRPRRNGFYCGQRTKFWSLQIGPLPDNQCSTMVVPQDNKSAMLENGTGSSSKRTRHIELWYYFVKEHVDSGLVG